MDRAPGRAVRSYLVASAFLSGFSVMVLEMAAVRAVAPYFGASNYTWTNVIGVVLLARSPCTLDGSGKSNNFSCSGMMPRMIGR